MSTQIAAPQIGFRFKHSRVVNWDDMKTPATYQVTRIARGTVYYRPVYDEGLPSERLGTVEQCSLEYFPKVKL